jgi:hypothetical protein
MVLKNFGEIIDGLLLVNIEIENISENILKSIAWIRAHVSHQIDQFCEFISVTEQNLKSKVNSPRREYG